jgi:hypothetical protein
MSKKQAEEIARQYIEAHQEQISGVSPRAIETAIKRVAGALTGLKSVRQQSDKKPLYGSVEAATHH